MPTEGSTRQKEMRRTPALLLCMVTVLSGLHSAGGFIVSTAPRQRELMKPRSLVKVDYALRFWENEGSVRKGEEKGVKDILAVDFDGVMCDSVDEQARAAYRTVQKLWPQITACCGTSGSPDDIPEWLLDVSRELRPVIENGYETVLLTRMCLEEQLRGSGAVPTINLHEIAASWHEKLRTNLLHRYGVSEQELVDAFGTVRGEWMRHDRRGWLSSTPFFAGTDLTIGHCRRFESYIVSSKQTRYVEAVLHGKGLTLPRDRIFGLGAGPVHEVLAKLVKSQREKAQGDSRAEREAVIHYASSRIDVLEKIAADPRLQSVQLYMADWGYCTKDDMYRAVFNPRIRTLDIADFSCMCRFLHGSNDFACFQPTVSNSKLSPERIVFSACGEERKEDGLAPPSTAEK